MTRGKKKCELLKAVRCQIAKKNGIEYTYTECSHQGDCAGTCPKCEEELRYLTREVEKLKQSGKQVAVAGVAAAVIAATAAGCGSDLWDSPFDGDQLQGDMVVDTEQVDGLMAPPTDEEIWMGDIAAPLPPEITEVVCGLEQCSPVDLSAFSRNELQGEWADWLTESTDEYDLFVVDEVQFMVTYDEYGWAIRATLFDYTTETDEPNS